MKVLTNAFSEVDENDIREHLEAVPASVDDDLGSVPELAGVAHPRLRQLEFFDLGLEPELFLLNGERVGTYRCQK